MKKALFILYVLSGFVLASCSGNKKLDQDNSAKAIYNFFAQHPFTESYRDYDEQGDINTKHITTIEPLSQFSDKEASTVVTFDYKVSKYHPYLKLKFIFQRNVDKHWILSTMTLIDGLDSERGGSNRDLAEYIQKAHDLNIVAQ